MRNDFRTRYASGGKTPAWQRKEGKSESGGLKILKETFSFSGKKFLIKLVLGVNQVYQQQYMQLKKLQMIKRKNNV